MIQCPFALDESSVLPRKAAEAPHSGHRPGVARKSYPQFKHRPDRRHRLQRQTRRAQTPAVAAGAIPNSPVTAQHGIPTAVIATLF